MSKPLWSALVIAALVAGAAAFLVSRRAPAHSHPGLPIATLGQSGHLGQELGLDASQRSAIDTLDRELARQLAALCGDYCAVRGELGTVLLEEGVHPADASRKLVARMSAIQADAEMATLDHVRKVSVLLTPVQRKKFLTDLTACLCGGDALCAGGCGKDEAP